MKKLASALLSVLLAAVLRVAALRAAVFGADEGCGLLEAVRIRHGRGVHAAAQYGGLGDSGDMAG